MATFSGTGPIKRAIVRRTRSDATLNAALVGGIHQRVAPRKIAYPYLRYAEVSAPFIRDWGNDVGGGREIHALYDLTIFAANPVQAENLLQHVDALFNDAEGELGPLVDGQRVLLCSVIGTIPGNGPERDDTGAYFAQMGLTVEIWTSQPT